MRHILDFDTAFSILNHEVEFGYTLNQANTGNMLVTYLYKGVELLFPFGFTEDELLPPGFYQNNSVEMAYNSDQRSKFVLKASLLHGSFYGGMRNRYLIGIKYRAQPWGNFTISLEQNDLKFPDPYGNTRLLLVSPRIEINFSKSLFWTTFIQYNTQADNFNINSRLQWRFLPMSDLYFVYTDNYAVEYWGPKNKSVVLKVNYWFNL
jgi:hypothetical protein